jgi:hypothetical protein
MNDIVIPWKKITRGLPKGKKCADDRAPIIEERRKIVEYPDRRIKPNCLYYGIFWDKAWRMGLSLLGTYPASI